jgi:hypothetical protein
MGSFVPFEFLSRSARSHRLSIRLNRVVTLASSPASLHSFDRLFPAYFGHPSDGLVKPSFIHRTSVRFQIRTGSEICRNTDFSRTCKRAIKPHEISFLPAVVRVYSQEMNPTQKQFFITGVSLRKANYYQLLCIVGLLPLLLVTSCSLPRQYYEGAQKGTNEIAIVTTCDCTYWKKGFAVQSEDFLYFENVDGKKARGWIAELLPGQHNLKFGYRRVTKQYNPNLDESGKDWMVGPRRNGMELITQSANNIELNINVEAGHFYQITREIKFDEDYLATFDQPTKIYVNIVDITEKVDRYDTKTSKIYWHGFPTVWRIIYDP